MRRHALFFCGLVLAVSGCAPNAVVYYRPSADRGIVVPKDCVPVDSLLDIVLETSGTSTRIRAWADDGDPISQVYLGFSGGSWNKINFTSTAFKVVDLDKHTAIEPLSVFANKDDGFTELNTEPYAAPKKPLMQMTRFSVQIRLPDPMPENFELSSPSIMIDGHEFAIPTIRFERRVWLGISPFNC